MKKLRRKLNKYSIYCFLLFGVFLIYYSLTHFYYNFVYEINENVLYLNNTKLSENFYLNEIELNSKCLCQKDSVYINNLNDTFNVLVDLKDKNAYVSYNLTSEILDESLKSCDLYKVLRRGPNQKLITYTIADKLESHNDINDFYYSVLNLIRIANKFYPDWIVRIYHDSRRIQQSYICELECSKNEDGIRYDNLDFCDVTKMPIDMNNYWDASYMLPMSWRWLPVVDNFVDIFISRDIFACTFDREIAAVNEWINSNSLFHIMRDHPSHSRKILGGLWGFYSSRNRTIGKNLFDIITDKYVSNWYQSYDESNKPDEYLLEKYVWPLAKINSTIHDSYHCFNNQGKPFPIQRSPQNCYVGQMGCCDADKNKNQPVVKICPKECRPQNHKNDWIYC